MAQRPAAPNGPHLPTTSEEEDSSAVVVDGVQLRTRDPKRSSISRHSFSSPLASPFHRSSPASDPFASPTKDASAATRIPASVLSHSNPALICHPEHSLSLASSSPLPPSIAPGSVLLQVKATGLCGSDLHFWHDGAIGPLKVLTPYVLGHEAAGKVLAVGPGVDNLKPGDRVALEPGVPCGKCWLCREGRYNLCEAVAFAGVWPHEGSCQRFKVHPATWCHKIPKSMSYAQGALLEPLCVVMHGVREAGVSMGRGVAVVGAGPIGLIALAVARASGAHPVVISDIEPRRLEFARSFVSGCRTYLVDRKLDAEGNAKAMRRLFVESSEEPEPSDEDPDPEGYFAPHVVLECTGTESGVGTAAFAARRGGTVMVIGVGKNSMNNLPFMHLSLSEIDLKFINRYRDLWPSAISSLAGGIVNLDALVTHVLPLEQAVQAMETSGDPSNGNIKVHVVDDTEISV